MAAKFIIPEFPRKSKFAAVYKITFDKKHFYIGGTENVRNRFTQWKTTMKLGINKNKKMRELVPVSSEIFFEILEYVPASISPKDREDFYIKQHWGNDLLLNKCPNANNNIGLKFTKEELATRRRPTNGAKPIAMFDIDWVFIERFDFIADAAKKLATRSKTITDFLKGRSQYVKGHKFKLIAKDGSYIEPVPFKSKKPPLKPKRIPLPNTPSKEVIQLSSEGEELQRFSSIWQLSRHLKANRANIRKILNGKKSKTGYYKGFIYRYA